MALKPKIQALIAYANETTEAGDVTLGDCVKTLADGYNGGANVPSAPLVIPSGEMSAKLAALLAYSNEVTGAGDTRMGDAIRTLCEGYRKEEPTPPGVVFYNRLIGDKVASIRTDFIPMPGDDIIVEINVKTGLNYNPRILGSGTGRYQTNITGSYIKYFTASSVNTSWSINTDYRLHFYPDGRLEKTNLVTGGSSIYTGMVALEKGPTDGVLFLFRNASSRANGLMDFLNVCIKREDNVVLNLRPCTYYDVAGMWDEVSQTFYGNAETTGAFSVSND